MVPGHEEIRATQTGHAAYDVTLHPRELTSKDMREVGRHKSTKKVISDSEDVARDRDKTERLKDSYVRDAHQ